MAIRLRRGRLAIAVLLVVGSGCTLLTGVGDLQEVACVVDCDASADAPFEAAPHEAAYEATPYDASVDVVAPDAHPDAGIEAASVGWCASQSPPHMFCVDFDDGSVTSGFDGGGLRGDASVVADPTFASSPPNSAKMTIPVGGGYVSLEQGFGQPLANAHFAFDVHIDSFDPSDPYPILATISLPDGHAFYVQPFPTAGLILTVQTRTADGGYTYSGSGFNPSTLPLPWGRIQIDTYAASPDGGVGSVGATVNGVTAVTPVKVSPVAVGTPTISIEIGGVSAAHKSWVVHYDNVTFDMN